MTAIPDTQPFNNRRAGFFSLRVLCLFAVFCIAGCGDESRSVALTDDEAELREREAIARLQQTGIECITAEDPWLETSGVLITLFPEHISESGRIRPDVFAEFRYMRKLFLNVDRTPISSAGLKELRTLDNLLLVSAQQTPTNDIGLAQVEGIVSLKLLRLNWTSVTDTGLRHIERLPNLVMLYLSGTKIGDDAVPHIVRLSHLTSLQLARTGITDEGVKALPELKQLTHLGLGYTEVSDASVDALLELKSLKYLSLTETRVTPDGLARLKAGLPDCFVEVKVATAAAGDRQARR